MHPSVRPYNALTASIPAALYSDCIGLLNQPKHRSSRGGVVATLCVFTAACLKPMPRCPCLSCAACGSPCDDGAVAPVALAIGFCTTWPASAACAV